MVSISLCMIVKNEEEVLQRCLESVKDLVDEIVIVDTGSTDKTKEIASEYTDKIWDMDWQNDFSKARNYAFEKAEQDYLMWMDADDVFPEQSRKKLRQLKETMTGEEDFIMMPYAVSFDDKGRYSFVYYRERIVKNRKGFWFKGKVHEVIQPSGKIIYADIPIEHRKIKEKELQRNLNIYTNMEENGEYFDSRALYYYGRELTINGKYEKASFILKKFLSRHDGWIENKIDALRQLAVCYRAMGKYEKEIKSLFNTFVYDVPRAETCCEIGRYYIERNEYHLAEYWLHCALKAEKNKESGAFISEDCYGFIPAILLCICYDRMGDLKRAEQYNELAGRFKPDSSCYLYNQQYFNSIK